MRMQLKNPALLFIVLSASALTSAHSLAQTQTPVPQITVVVPPGTNTEIVSVETHVVGPGEIQIGAPVVERAPITIVPPVVQPSQSPTQEVHLQINLRLRIDTPTAPVVYAAPPVYTAPVPPPPQVALPERAPQHLQLRREAPRRSYALPLSFMGAGAVTTILGGMTAALDEELAFLPAIGAGLLVTGVVMLLVRVSRYRRARRDYDRQAQFTF